ncbi:hypothetical protein [Sphingomonas sp. M1-B02]|uniref:hypothetical protein n=1 Tax=Sphingomonas sp. M1-B02 TaxID=3114300 RepID=UPI0022407B83|nr:hypothetical protein [Sphingomonas sp. S6-11]UZK66387.1 hypothetical protein OKW87_00665 [Sphingomonas sp. S6-11]
MRPYEPYVPQTIGEIWDLLGSMMLGSPTFVDKTGYFPQQSIDTEFFALKEGLNAIRKRLGEERYEKLVEMADRMRAHFEADPEDKTDDSLAGRQLIYDMEDVLREARKSK